MDLKQMAFLYSLLDPDIVEGYLNGAPMVSFDYFISTDNLSDTPDILGLFNNKKERKEFHDFIHDSDPHEDYTRYVWPDNNGIPVFSVLHHCMTRFGSVRLRKYLILSTVYYMIGQSDCERPDIKSVYRYLNTIFLTNKYSSVETEDRLKLFNENVNTLSDYLHFNITLTLSHFYSEFNIGVHEKDTLGPWVKNGLMTTISVWDNSPMIQNSLVGNLSNYNMDYVVDNAIHRVVQYVSRFRTPTFNPRTALISGFIHPRKRFDTSDISGTVEAYLRRKGVKHRLALNQLDELPVNGLTESYRGLISYDNGNDITFTDQMRNLLLS